MIPMKLVFWMLGLFGIAVIRVAAKRTDREFSDRAPRR
jgi:hypothetical protein